MLEVLPSLGSVLVAPFFFFTFSFLCEYEGLGGVRLVNRKMFCGGEGRERMEEQGGRLFLENGKRQTVSRKWEKREGRGEGGGERSYECY